MDSLPNAYADEARAESYARLGFPATYWLAYRDLPALLAEHVSGIRAVDFGCGAGRSTRFLRELGYDVVGVDVSGPMVRAARKLDPGGRYLLVDGDGPGDLPAGAWDLVLCALPFDNMAGAERRVQVLDSLRALLEPTGRLVLLASAPEIYTHEWATFSTAEFPGNARARSGDLVRIVIREGGDSRPIEDVVWFDVDYREAFARAGLDVRVTHRPLGRNDEPWEWTSETRVSPWVIYVTAPSTPSNEVAT